MPDLKENYPKELLLIVQTTALLGFALFSLIWIYQKFSLNNEDKQRYIESLFNQALHENQKNSVESLKKVIRLSVKNNTFKMRSYAILMEIFYKNREFEEFERYFELFLKGEDGSESKFVDERAAVYFYKAQVMKFFSNDKTSEERIREAITYYEKAFGLAIDRNIKIAAEAALGNCYIHLDKTDEAKPYLERASASGSFMASQNLGYIYFEKQLFAKAKKFFIRASNQTSEKKHHLELLQHNIFLLNMLISIEKNKIHEAEIDQTNKKTIEHLFYDVTYEEEQDLKKPKTTVDADQSDKTPSPKWIAQKKGIPSYQEQLKAYAARKDQRQKCIECIERQIHQNKKALELTLPPKNVPANDYETLKKIFKQSREPKGWVEFKSYQDLLQHLGGDFDFKTVPHKATLPQRENPDTIVTRFLHPKHRKEGNNDRLQMTGYEHWFIKSLFEEAGYFDISSFKRHK